MSTLDGEPSFIEGYNQGYEDGYLKALNAVIGAVQELRDEAEKPGYELPDYMQALDMTWTEIR